MTRPWLLSLIGSWCVTVVIRKEEKISGIKTNEKEAGSSVQTWPYIHNTQDSQFTDISHRNILKGDWVTKSVSSNLLNTQKWKNPFIIATDTMSSYVKMCVKTIWKSCRAIHTNAQVSERNISKRRSIVLYMPYTSKLIFKFNTIQIKK